MQLTHKILSPLHHVDQHLDEDRKDLHGSGGAFNKNTRSLLEYYPLHLNKLHRVLLTRQAVLVVLEEVG